MTTLLATHPAIAGLYGFDKANPYTAEEKILDMKYLPKQIRNYRADMRNNLQMLINYAKKIILILKSSLTKDKRFYIVALGKTRVTAIILLVAKKDNKAA